MLALLHSSKAKMLHAWRQATQAVLHSMGLVEGALCKLFMKQVRCSWERVEEREGEGGEGGKERGEEGMRSLFKLFARRVLFCRERGREGEGKGVGVRVGGL